MNRHFVVFLKFGFLIISVLSLAFTQEPDGRQLFQMHCSTCHTIGHGKLVGPDLLNIGKQRDNAWLKSFITSSQSLILKGDTAAVNLFNEYNKIIMPDQISLADKQIDAILAYIQILGKEFLQSARESKDFKRAMDVSGINKPDIAEGPDKFP